MPMLTANVVTLLDERAAGTPGKQQRRSRYLPQSS
jgi:hypothetical protein